MGMYDSGEEKFELETAYDECHVLMKSEAKGQNLHHMEMRCPK